MKILYRSIAIGLVFFVSLLTEVYSNPIIEGCAIFPANNIWNTPIDELPVDPNSSMYINTIGSDIGLHPDFGSGEWGGGPIGIPYTVVPGTQPKVQMTFYYVDESDPGPYPIPPDALIEGGKDATGDRHVLVMDKDNCMLYELFDAHAQTDNSWHAGSGAVFDLGSHVLRPDTWTSADAAGLPILPGLVRYAEVLSGEIAHAIRFTAPRTRKAHLWPARHDASYLTGAEYPPMGQRFRLKAGYDISGFPAKIQTILRAFKKYGIILADNGSAWFISGVPDSRWDNDVLRCLREVKGSDFEAVDVSSLMINENSGEVREDTENHIVYVSKNNTNCGGNSPCYDTIQSAIDSASNLSRIFIAKGSYAEGLSLNRSIALILQGGWAHDFSVQNGITILRNGPRVILGSMTLRDLIIEPE